MEDVKFYTETITKCIIERLEWALDINDIDELKYAIEIAICETKRLDELVKLAVKYDKMDNFESLIDSVIEE